MGQEWEKAFLGVLLQSWRRDLGIGSGGTEGEVNIYSQPTFFSGWSNWWVSRESELIFYGPIEGGVSSSEAVRAGLVHNVSWISHMTYRNTLMIRQGRYEYGSGWAKKAYLKWLEPLLVWPMMHSESHQSHYKSPQSQSRTDSISIFIPWNLFRSQEFSLFLNNLSCSIDSSFIFPYSSQEWDN